MRMINGWFSRAAQYPIAQRLLRRMFDGRWSATSCQQTNKKRGMKFRPIKNTYVTSSSIDELNSCEKELNIQMWEGASKTNRTAPFLGSLFERKKKKFSTKKWAATFPFSTKNNIMKHKRTKEEPMHDNFQIYRAWINHINPPKIQKIFKASFLHEHSVWRTLTIGENIGKFLFKSVPTTENLRRFFWGWLEKNWSGSMMKAALMMYHQHIIIIEYWHTTSI